MIFLNVQNADLQYVGSHDEIASIVGCIDYNTIAAWAKALRKTHLDTNLKLCAVIYIKSLPNPMYLTTSQMNKIITFSHLILVLILTVFATLIQLCQPETRETVNECVTASNLMI